MSNTSVLLDEHAAQTSRLSVNTFVWTSDEPSDEIVPSETYVLIKGNSVSLKFLGELLIRFSEGEGGPTFFLHPTGPGSAHFSPDSTVGLYLECTDCK